MTGNYERLPDVVSFSLSDDIRLYLDLLLCHMPLNRIKLRPSADNPDLKVWPTNSYGQKLHRKFHKKLSVQLGEEPTLHQWYQVFQRFLTEKLAPYPNHPNRFNWEDFHMSSAEIHDTVVETTFRFGQHRVRESS